MPRRVAVLHCSGTPGALPRRVAVRRSGTPGALPRRVAVRRSGTPGDLPAPRPLVQDDVLRSHGTGNVHDA